MSQRIFQQSRRSIRLKGYDYSQEGLYFITICCQDRACLFGEIIQGEMILNDAGRMIEKWYRELENKYPDRIVHKMVVMPNHIHGIIGIVHTPHSTVRTCHGVSQQGQTNQFGKTIAGSLSAIIGQFKSTLTRWSRKNGHENFAWQGRFHDHIIRNDGAFQRISNYIKNNPTNWHKDKFSTH